MVCWRNVIFISSLLTSISDPESITSEPLGFFMNNRWKDWYRRNRLTFPSKFYQIWKMQDITVIKQFYLESLSTKMDATSSSQSLDHFIMLIQSEQSYNPHLPAESLKVSSWFGLMFSSANGSPPQGSKMLALTQQDVLRRMNCFTLSARKWSKSFTYGQSIFLDFTLIFFAFSIKSMGKTWNSFGVCFYWI